MIQAEHLVGEVANQQVLTAGAIVIGGIDTHGSARHSILTEGNAGGHRDVGERSIMIVAVQLVGLGVISNKQIGPTVVVDIEHRDTQGFAGSVA